MAQTTIAAEIHQPLDVDRHLAAQIALDEIVPVDGFADLQHLGVSQLRDPPLGRNVYRSEIYSLIEGITGVDHVVKVMINDSDVNVVEIEEYELISIDRPVKILEVQ